MPERPLLIFPKPEPVSKPKGSGGDREYLPRQTKMDKPRE